MCLYPKLIRNKKYEANKKNGGEIPLLKDERMVKVPVKCGKCMECRKQIAREWQVRLMEDIIVNKNGKFITLTFSNESITELDEAVEEIEREAAEGSEPGTGRRSEGYERDNRIAVLGIRRFLERWRKEYGRSIRHWLITECGGNGTENIHLHGIIWTDEDLRMVEKIWKYGYMWKGKEAKNGITGKTTIINYVSEATANYITKYITKVDKKHGNFKGKICSSKGIGGGYTQRMDAGRNVYKEDGKTEEYYRTRTGHKIAMPIYWRNKIYSEEEREKLWIEKLNREERWVNGVKISIAKGEREYYAALKEAQELNKELKYGGHNEGWEKADYENQRRNMLRAERKKKKALPG